jgi:hypothetical protein
VETLIDATGPMRLTEPENNSARAAVLLVHRYSLQVWSLTLSGCHTHDADAFVVGLSNKKRRRLKDAAFTFPDT